MNLLITEKLLKKMGCPYESTAILETYHTVISSKEKRIYLLRKRLTYVAKQRPPLKILKEIQSKKVAVFKTEKQRLRPCYLSNLYMADWPCTALFFAIHAALVSSGFFYIQQCFF
jgi:hypothetical protein